jgi:hypothetical protein
MKTEEQLLTDEKLLSEIIRLRSEIDSIRDDHFLHDIEYSIADDYLMSDAEAHIDKLEKEYKRRGLKLPERYPE